MFAARSLPLRVNSGRQGRKGKTSVAADFADEREMKKELTGIEGYETVMRFSWTDHHLKFMPL
ncbi:MAG TPA: hypothetical protein VNV88_13955 [Candidatus Solibacter sp.]|nr:hypothetical protein [Candidatus Solibacter sp.]